MKLLKIVWKNFKLLMRSKTSAFIIVFGPLLVIMLVGMSFNLPSEFNLNLGIYAKTDTPIIDSFVSKLNSENYVLVRYPSETECIENVKLGSVHSCISFPDDFSISNNKENLVKVYVDQSRINLAYVVLNSIEGSFSNRSAEISTDLTQNILNVVSETRKVVDVLNTGINSTSAENSGIRSNAGEAQTLLSAVDYTTSSNSTRAKSSIMLVAARMTSLKDDLLVSVSDSLDAISQLEEEGITGNQTEYVDDIKDRLKDINESVTAAEKDTAYDISKAVADFDKAIVDLSNRLNNAKTVNDAVLAKVRSISESSSRLQDKLDSIHMGLDAVAGRIDGIQVTQSKTIVSPITTQVTPVVKSKSSLSFLFPSLIVILVMFTALLMPALIIIIEKNSRAYFRIFTTPTPSIYFTAANYLTAFTLLLVQLALILGVSEIYFKLQLGSQIRPIFIVMLLIASFFILLGMFLGYVINTEEMATLTAVSIGSIMLLTSGLIFPLESMPRAVTNIARFNPFVLSTDLFKKVLLFNAPFSSLGFEYTHLLIYSLVVLVTMILVMRIGDIRIIHLKPNRREQDQDKLRMLFKTKAGVATTMTEFIQALEEMPDSQLVEVIFQNAIPIWLTSVYGSPSLAHKVKTVKTKAQILEILRSELSKAPK